MTLLVEKDINIRTYTTFKLDCIVQSFIRIDTKQDLLDALAYAKLESLPVIILGGGSNSLFIKEKLSVCLLKIEIDGYTWKEIDENITEVSVGAGIVWDDFVLETVKRNLSGIEMLSLIPGSVGATPVQNVGAYGGDVSQTLVTVDVFDMKENQFKILNNQDCLFSYRDSIFKKQKDRYIIISVTFRLFKNKHTIPNYPGMKEFFNTQDILNPTIEDIRSAICTIRTKKLPDPKYIYSVGSFFKNPIVSSGIAKQLKAVYPNAVIFDVGNNLYKIGAGWLIDQAGLKGKQFGNLSLYEYNALVIVNNGNATGQELLDLISFIQKIIKETFSIDIEPEPVFID